MMSSKSGRQTSQAGISGGALGLPLDDNPLFGGQAETCCPRWPQA